MAVPLFSQVCALLDDNVGHVLTPERAAAIAREFMHMVLGQPLDIESLDTFQSGNYTLQPERCAAVLPELAKLHLAHWQETEHYRHGLEFNPDYEGGLMREACGEYLLLTMRHEGALVGNFGMAFSRSAHTQTLLAQEDTVFISPEHRKGRNFLRLMQYGEYAARHFGARELRLTTKLTNRVADMLPRMGYEHVAQQFVKFL